MTARKTCHNKKAADLKKRDLPHATKLLCLWVFTYVPKSRLDGPTGLPDAASSIKYSVIVIDDYRKHPTFCLEEHLHQLRFSQSGDLWFKLISFLKDNFFKPARTFI